MKALSRTLEAAILAQLTDGPTVLEPIPMDEDPCPTLEALLLATADDSAGPGCPGHAWAPDGRPLLRMPVWAGGSERTIWSSPEVNWAFRAVHDHLHILHCAGFTDTGEHVVARAHEALLRGTPADNPGDRLILRAEIMGQLLHFRHWGAFPVDQRAFVVRCVRKGIMGAVAQGRI